MSNIFSKIEEELLFNEEIVFDENKIKEYVKNYLVNKLNLLVKNKQGFAFEEVIYDFLEYMNLNLIKTNKTRDQGIDGIIKMSLGFFGEINLGLQIKYKLIDSNDVDLFLSSLRNAEIQLGVIVCKESRDLNKYELNSKLRTILLSKGIEVKEKLIKDKININPILILKFDEVIEIVASQIRAIAKSIYKK